MYFTLFFDFVNQIINPSRHFLKALGNCALRFLKLVATDGVGLALNLEVHLKPGTVSSSSDTTLRLISFGGFGK